jgi:hypothetical protein
VDVEKPNMTKVDLDLQKEAYDLAKQLFGDEAGADNVFANKLIDICTRVQGKDFLIIHNPGGWGQTQWERCQDWERSIVVGVCNTVEGMGYSSLLIQYLRTCDGWRELLRDLKEQFRFFANKSTVMATGLKFIIKHVSDLKVILVGVSQGAAFSNSVMQKLDEPCQVYSVEIGYFFPYMRWRVVTERTLAIDSNGIMPDPAVHRNLKIGAKSLLLAPFRWLRYRLRGTPVKLALCIDIPGHDYNWDYPEVRRQIRDFLKANFAANK